MPYTVPSGHSTDLRAVLLLITPPFTQLNTPYPATAYLKGFLNTKGIAAAQMDLGIETTLALFSQLQLAEVFARAALHPGPSPNALRILAMKDGYLRTIDAVITFLQGKNPTLAHRIAQRNFLPEASRFAQTEDLQHAFGQMGLQDKAKHLATLYLEDLSDFIKECLDPHFGFSRYAERLGRSAATFDALEAALQAPLTFVDELMLDILRQRVERLKPTLVAFSVPFPGNLYSALRCGRFLKETFPDVKIVMGGGFPNTELRALSDPRVFDYVDFITLDDGEAPVENLLAHLEGRLPLEGLKRTFIRTPGGASGSVIFINNADCKDYRQGEIGTPDYDGLPLDQYISAIELSNPMHSLWSDGRWNKLTMAHGCYWGKCTFCDISLPYIRDYEPSTAAVIADRMQELTEKTGTTGFHFVDEAAPPALMRALALEILKRNMVVSWWANIRFEKAFTRDLCQLLKASGCIAVSGGLEVASDRLLALIQKGITVAQVARVNKHFTEAGIMVHAYLMYGFPTQTAQETVDSLEMVRQMFSAGILQSAFWHQFAMTAHAPVGLQPAAFGVEKESEAIGAFANNDIVHRDPTGAAHDDYAYGLRKSLLNYMHGIGFDTPLYQWFDFKTPKTSVKPDHITAVLEAEEYAAAKPTAKVVFAGALPAVEVITKSKKGASWELASLTFESLRGTHNIKVPVAQGAWLAGMLPRLSPAAPPLILADVKADYESAGLEDFELFWDNKPVDGLWKVGLWTL